MEAAKAAGESEALGLRVYTSRIIGGDPDRVLHGGGNTSVKVTAADGERLRHIKGSGWDLDTIEGPGLPAVRMAPLLETRSGPRLSDPEMVALLRASLIEPNAPNPSVEALLHAFLPFDTVDHTHATAILALADQPDMRDTIARIYGTRLAYVPYVMPGFDLSIAADRVYRDHPGCEGLWLENHGIFTFADDARRSYELMIEFVGMAEAELAARGVVLTGPQPNDGPRDAALAARLEAALRRAGSPFERGLAMDYRSTAAIRDHVSKPDVEAISLRGTVTPDHVIRIKPWPMIIEAGADETAIAAALDAYAERYAAYFQRHAPRADEPKTMLDAYPRVVIVRGEGMFALGTNAKAASIAGDLCEQATRAINAAEAYGRFTPIGEADLFDMEYWSLEQAKLAVSKSEKSGGAPRFTDPVFPGHRDPSIVVAFSRLPKTHACAIVNQMVQYSASSLDLSFAALADATRRGILEDLRRGEASITALADRFRMTLTGIAKHIRVLETAGLVETEKAGRVRVCRLGERGLAAEAAWIDAHRRLFEDRFDALDAVIRDIKREENHE